MSRSSVLGEKGLADFNKKGLVGQGQISEDRAGRSVIREGKKVNHAADVVPRAAGAEAGSDSVKLVNIGDLL
jgi:hypothetical protein